MKVTLPSRYRSRELELPVGWDIDVISPQRVAIPPRLPLIESALDAPTGGSTLEGIVSTKLREKPGRTCIICEDLTRYSPTDEILPLLLNRLNNAGVPDEDVFVVMALGTHRPMTDAEIEAKIGSETKARVEVHNSEFRDKRGLVRVGSFGDHPLWLDRRVAEASVRIGVGSVVPNPVSGWSGGAKIMIPGVTGEETVRGFHLSSHEFRENMFGQEMTSSRELMESLVGQIGLDFVVNSVYTPEGQIYAVLCGDFVEAQRVAIRRAKEVYGSPARRRSGLVISNAYPAETDLWQAGKAFHSGDLVAEDGGEVVAVASCPEGIGPHKGLPDFYQWALRDREELLRAAKGGAVDDVIGASSALMRTKTIMSRVRLGIVSDNLDRRVMERMGISVYDSLEEVIERHKAGATKPVTVSVITHGGSTFPVL